MTRDRNPTYRPEASVTAWREEGIEEDSVLTPRSGLAARHRFSLSGMWSLVNPGGRWCWGLETRLAVKLWFPTALLHSACPPEARVREFI